MNKPLNSWRPVASHHDFSIHNLPFGIFSTDFRDPRIGIAYGDEIIDLMVLFESGLLGDLGEQDLALYYSDKLNGLMEEGKAYRVALRDRLQELLSTDCQDLQEDTALHSEVFVSMANAKMHLPFHIPNYTDFYSSEQHAINVGSMFRDPDNALLPNWKHLPVGYHGRASSIRLGSDAVRRPRGQVLALREDIPKFQPTDKLDFELEMAFVNGKKTALGAGLSMDAVEEHIFGFVLFNDWSARDIQKWEYVPLGPFLGKSFASSISPWVVTLEALEPFRVAGPQQEPPVADYLQHPPQKKYHFDLQLEVALRVKGSDKDEVICRSNYQHLYWSIAQQLVHQASNGCNLEVGDLYASGTISGENEGSFGSLLELSWNGSKPLQLQNGVKRTFLEDGDVVIMRAFTQRDGIRVGFGEIRTEILPAN
ncbi:MAG: fumarylacetoacetase [Cyclobacteriaceae bacterium]|nr:fumarylacetoacetase [Cyclobacteriaceae bacterium]MCH8517586.1 fumarylacetoacetase [Cyclobacteriaceae bacterium]